MAVAEDIGLDSHRFARRALDRKCAAVDLRLHAFDNNTVPALR